MGLILEVMHEIMEDRQANMMIDGQELAATGRESAEG